MKNKYFNEREKRLFDHFSKKNDFYKGCYFGETNPIIDKKINKIEKVFVSDCKKQLKKTIDKHEQEELLELIQFYDKSEVKVQKMEEEVVVPAVIEEKVVKKADQKVKDPFIFKTEPYRRDCSRLVYWCNPLNLLIRANLAALKTGELKNPLGAIIRC